MLLLLLSLKVSSGAWGEAINGGGTISDHCEMVFVGPQVGHWENGVGLIQSIHKSHSQRRIGVPVGTAPFLSKSLILIPVPASKDYKSPHC